MQTFLLNLLIKAVQNPTIRAFLFDVVERLAASLAPKLMSVIPLATAAGIKEVSELFRQAANIDLPGPLPSVGELADRIHNTVNGQLDIDIPIVSDVVKDVTGFDLSDVVNGWLHR